MTILVNQFQEMLSCNCYKVSVGRMKECDVVTIGFTKFARDRKDQISKVNSENQWFRRYCIGIHRLPYKIIDNIFVNLCLENEKCTLLLHKCIRNGIAISKK